MKAGPSLGASRGFTLIELMIAVAIIGILAGVVYPSYTDHVRRGRIAAALGELSTVQVRLEQYYQDNRHYGSTATACAVPLPAVAGFDLACSWGAAATAQSFVATATGTSGRSTAGYAYSVDQANQQRTLQFAGQAVNAACWLKRKGESC